MLLALSDRRLPSMFLNSWPCCGNYNLLPLPYLFLYLYQHCYHYQDYCYLLLYYYHHHNQQQQGANDILQHVRLLRPNSPANIFLIFQKASTLILQRRRFPRAFGAMVACIVQDWKEVSEQPKILKKKTILKKGVEFPTLPVEKKTSCKLQTQ